MTLTHSTQRKHAFLVKTKEKSKWQNKSPKKKVYFELLHQRSEHRSTGSLLAGDTANICQDIELRVDPDPLFTSCQICTINKKAISNTPLKPKAPFKWMFMDIIPATSSKSSTKKTLAKLPLNHGCLFQYSKTLWNGKHHH